MVSVPCLEDFKVIIVCVCVCVCVCVYITADSTVSAFWASSVQC